MEASMSPPITAEQLFSIDDELHPIELIDGRVRIMEPGGTPHSISTTAVALTLAPWIRERKLGYCLSGEPGFITGRNPDTVRAPDFAFIAAGRLPDPPPDGYPELVPDFLVEIVGKADPAERVHRKARWWLDQGAGEAWVVDPRSRTATVHLPGGVPRELGPEDSIEASGPLAGLSCRVADLFS
jgi:Uma2 family endonuclease